MLPRSSPWRVAPLCLLSALCLFTPTQALGQAAPAATATASEPTAALPPDGARVQFEQALTLYRAGQYAAALLHLQQAAQLDPAGKDLFFNLALVHEKLGQLSEAIAALERFRELETDRAERERARLTIQRLRGAKETAKPPASEPCPAPRPPPAPPQRPSPVVVGAASLAAVSLIVGVVFGTKALSDDVGGERTSPELSLHQLRERGRRAERNALVADIAFALSAASAGTAVGLWLLTPSEPSRAAGITLRSYF